LWLEVALKVEGSLSKPLDSVCSSTSSSESCVGTGDFAVQPNSSTELGGDGMLEISDVLGEGVIDSSLYVSSVMSESHKSFPR
jgi:hypothetical protein